MTVRREILENKTQTTLNGAINGTATTLTAADGAVFPSTGDFRIRINDEIMLVTARTGNMLTIVRGQDGTTAAAHADTDSIRMVLTEGALQRYGRDNDPWFDAGRPPFARIVDGNGDTLTASSFTQVNPAFLVSATDANGTIVLRHSGHTGDSVSLLVRTAPSTPYSIVAAWTPMFFAGSNSPISAAGICFRESSTGKLIFLQSTNNDWLRCAVTKMNSPTSFNSNYTEGPLNTQLPIWGKITDDGTNLIFEISTDGMTWVQIVSVSRTNFLAGGPDEVGILINNFNSSGQPDVLAHFLHWDEGA